MTKIKITIPTKGKIKLAVEGGRGDSCTLLTKPYEARLGGEVDEQRLLPEYFELETETELNRETN